MDMETVEKWLSTTKTNPVVSELACIQIDSYSEACDLKQQLTVSFFSFLVDLLEELDMVL